MFVHYSVMRAQCIDALQIRPDGVYVDMTLGGGGHSLEIAKRLRGGRLIAFDRDREAIAAAGERLQSVADRVTLVHRNFKELIATLDELGVDKIDGVLFDLGVSSYQLDTAERGFSYHMDAPLDMRMDQSTGITAKDVVNTYSETELANVIFRYGEERYARRIAKEIVTRRKNKPIETTMELSELIKSVFPAKERFADKHPAKRTFQALRIEVNAELQDLDKVLEEAVERLSSGGRIVVLTFHSLEDRIVKNTFTRLSTGCMCDKSMPVCVCHHKEVLRLIGRKPTVADEAELAENTRSKPAKLRVGEKI